MEKRLIDANAIPYVESEDGVLNDYAFRYDINEMPTVDAVEVVRCKNCRWFSPYKPGKISKGECNHAYGMCGNLKPSDYCSLGERKNNG